MGYSKIVAGQTSDCFFAHSPFHEKAIGRCSLKPEVLENRVLVFGVRACSVCNQRF
ncbi:hypothetical protein HMPREF1981_00159 [Bacteroides pyogenes F0041]|uniref:Uncharacterized protein n=1 Tax=Bacteroides pyogenes F0041 TaxID=1321819 RepID=U2CWI3_9BACE|nr:hypothetical protein HMPREF1981_00159 [Bacteroides pyogenes F0041]